MRKVQSTSPSLGADSLLARSLSYHLISGKIPHDETARLELYNRTYLFWKEFWSTVFKDNGTDRSPNPDDMLRQDWIGVLEHGNRPIALHAHSLFDLRQIAAKEHSYLSGYFTDHFLRSLEARGANRVLSFECYSVAPSWRTPNLGVSLGAVMVGLGIKVLRSVEVDAGIGVARCDLGVDKMVENQGATVIQNGLQAHNTPVALVAFYPDCLRQHPSNRVARLIDYFWLHKNDAATSPKREAFKTAA